MRDTREEIEDVIHIMLDNINSRLDDPDDDFTEGYMNIGGEDVMIGEFNQWVKGNAKYVSNKLFNAEFFDRKEYDTMCYAIGATFLENLIGSNYSVHLRCLLDREERELHELYDEDDDEDLLDGDLEEQFDRLFGGDDDDQG